MRIFLAITKLGMTGMGFELTVFWNSRAES